MATFRIIAWRDIPASVEARDEREQVTLPLSDRFQALIDAVAMQTGAHEDETYLEHWGATDGERPGPAGEVATAVVAELEQRFEDLARTRAGAAGR